MNTNLLAISNMFAGTSGAAPASAKSTAVKQSKQFSPSTLGNRPLTNSRGTETADNTLVNPQNGPGNGSPSEFGPIPGIKVPQKGENSKNATKQNQTPVQAIQPSVVQLWLAQYSLNIEHGKEGIARKVEPKAGYELAQSLTNLKPDKFPSVAGKATPPKISKAPLSTDIPSDEGENANRIRMPDTRPLATKGLDNEKSGEEPPLEAHIRAQNRISAANGKPEVVPVSNAFGSLKTSPLFDEGLPPQVLVDNDSELTGVSKQPVITGKSVVPENQKVPEQNPNLSLVQDKPSGLQPQPVGIGLRKSPLTAEEGVDNRNNPAQQGQILPEASTDNKAAAVQSGHPGTQQFSGSLADDFIGKGGNFTGKSLSQKLHNPQLKVSTVSRKGPGSSASNKNADSGFEQVLSGNNAATYIEEHTSIFPEAVKTYNLPAQTSPGGVSASITEQILESIQSSSSQQAGTQQITIRLNPPELGKVFIKFEEQENQLIGLVEVSKAQTRYEVEQALPQIIQNLADCGIQIKRLEVMLTDQNEQQSYGDESLQDGSFQQHHDLPEWDNPDHPGTIGANDPEIIGNSSSYRDDLGSQMQITADSINILI